MKCLNHAVLQNCLKSMLLTEEPYSVTTAAQLRRPADRKRIPKTRKSKFHGRCSGLDLIRMRTSSVVRERLAAGGTCTLGLPIFVSLRDRERSKTIVGSSQKGFPHGVCAIFSVSKGPALSTDGLQVGLSEFPRDVLARKPLVDLDFFWRGPPGQILPLGSLALCCLSALSFRIPHSHVKPSIGL